MCGFICGKHKGGEGRGERRRDNVLTLPRALVKLIKSKYFVLKLVQPAASHSLLPSLFISLHAIKGLTLYREAQMFPVGFLFGFRGTRKLLIFELCRFVI